MLQKALATLKTSLKAGLEAEIDMAVNEFSASLGIEVKTRKKRGPNKKSKKEKVSEETTEEETPKRSKKLSIRKRRTTEEASAGPTEGSV
mgnify:CR=1 FL=1